MTPVLIISLEANLFKGIKNFKEKGYESGCLFIIYASLVFLFIYMLKPEISRITKKNRNKNEKLSTLIV